MNIITALKRRAARAFHQAFDSALAEDYEEARRAQEEASAARRAALLAALPSADEDPAASGVAARDSGSWAAAVGRCP